MTNIIDFLERLITVLTKALVRAAETEVARAEAKTQAIAAAEQARSEHLGRAHRAVKLAERLQGISK